MLDSLRFALFGTDSPRNSGEMVCLSMALFEEIRMSASPHKDDQPRFVSFIEFVGQQKVATNMTLSVTCPLTT